LNEQILIIILAIAIHYLIGYSENMGNYECPEYCKVEHEHIIKKEKLNEYSRDDGIALFQR
tara:strand:+ start:2665 stop:2847 length:183 start_codon:yes stop_codon:yes gene_type:complete